MSENLEPLPPPASVDAFQSIIYTWRDPILHEKAEWITNFEDPWLGAISSQLISAMRYAHGVGMAANQIGYHQRMFVCIDAEDPTITLTILNPVIEEKTLPKKRIREGCLSIPHYVFEIPRYDSVLISGYNLKGDYFLTRAAGFQAQVFQHETDHLDGLLCIDRLSDTLRKRTYRGLEKDKQ